jgi:hypothetical protein
MAEESKRKKETHNHDRYKKEEPSLDLSEERFDTLLSWTDPIEQVQELALVSSVKDKRVYSQKSQSPHKMLKAEKMDTKTIVQSLAKQVQILSKENKSLAKQMINI